MPMLLNDYANRVALQIQMIKDRFTTALHRLKKKHNQELTVLVKEQEQLNITKIQKNISEL